MTTDQNKSPPANAAERATYWENLCRTYRDKAADASRRTEHLELVNEDLLEACETALKDYQQHIPSAETVPNILRAAIAKARGQQ